MIGHKRQVVCKPLLLFSTVTRFLPLNMFAFSFHTLPLFSHLVVTHLDGKSLKCEDLNNIVERKLNILDMKKVPLFPDFKNLNQSGIQTLSKFRDGILLASLSLHSWSQSGH